MAGSSTADLRVTTHSGGGADDGPAFFFDLASPEAYLSAERILALVPVPVEWVPVRAADLGGGGFGAWRCAEERAIELAELERRAAARGLQPVRWPAELPFDSDFAQRAATYAKGGGKTVAFALAAFRQAYAGGRDLGDPQNVMIAAAACEIHPRALLAGAGTGAVARQLDAATAGARERGVRSVPAVWTGREVFHGDAALEAAVRALPQPSR
jgi:2-hydroxychromene-2-carboxylate isomerase